MGLGLLALPAHAQSWATQEMCDVQDAVVHPEVLAPFTEDSLHKAAADIPNSVGRLWQVTSPDGAVSHLWGTMHSQHPLVLALPDPLMQAIAKARVVAVETDFTTSTRAELYDLYTAKHRYLEEGQPSYSTLNLPIDLDHRIRERFASLGWGYDGPDILNLSAIAEILLSDPCNDFSSGIYPIQDFRIQMLGDIAGARIMGLEDSLMFYDRFASGLQDTGTLKAMIAVYGSYLNPDMSNQSYATAFALYLQGQIGALMAWDKAYFDSLDDNGQYAAWLEQTNAFLLTERNINFVYAALPELETGGMVIAVGTYHLPGQSGMIELLRGAGFTVDRIVAEGEAPE